MGFVRIENYDGEKGYLPEGLVRLPVVELDGVKYLLNRDNDNAYRILREGDDIALATTIKNKRIINSLNEKHEKDLDYLVSETLWDVIE